MSLPSTLIAIIVLGIVFGLLVLPCLVYLCWRRDAEVDIPDSDTVSESSYESFGGFYLRKDRQPVVLGLQLVTDFIVKTGMQDAPLCAIPTTPFNAAPEQENGQVPRLSSEWFRPASQTDLEQANLVKRQSVSGEQSSSISPKSNSSISDSVRTRLLQLVGRTFASAGYPQQKSIKLSTQRVRDGEWPDVAREEATLSNHIAEAESQQDNTFVVGDSDDESEFDVRLTAMENQQRMHETFGREFPPEQVSQEFSLTVFGSGKSMASLYK